MDTAGLDLHDRHTDRLDQLRKRFQATALALTPLCTNEGPDVRHGVFAKLCGVLNCVLLERHYVRHYLSRKGWWQESFGQGFGEALGEELLNMYSGYSRVNFGNTFVSVVESYFRILARAMDPAACQNGTASFESVYQWVLTRTNQQDWRSLLDLWRLVRNTMHNDGTFVPHSGKDQSVTFDGVEYAFRAGSVIDFMNWPMLIRLCEETHEMLNAIVYSTAVQSLRFTLDHSPVYA